MFKDQFSLPFRRPKDADTHTRKLVKETLPNETKNTKIKALLGIDTARQEAELIDSLTSMIPMSIKLCAALHELSNIAIKERILGQFHTSSSVLRLGAEWNTYEDQGMKAKDSDLRMITHLSTNGPNIILDWLKINTCPTLAMDTVRGSLTQKDLSCPSAPVPLFSYE